MRSCGFCNASLEGAYPNARYCDSMCRGRAAYQRRAGRATQQCTCGKRVSDGREFCSRECFYTTRRADLVSRTEKPCKTCGVVKSLDDFYACKALVDGRQISCRSCVKKYRRAQTIKSYGISPDDYAELIRQQGGGCAICGATENQSGLSLPVDHDHDTGRVRGVLCSNCNTGIGMLGDSPERIEAAAAYLRRAKTG